MEFSEYELIFVMHNHDTFTFNRTLFPPEEVSLAKEMIDLAEIDPETRPYQLTIDEFSRLCGAYLEICRRHPGLIEYYFRDEVNALEWKYHRPASI